MTGCNFKTYIADGREHYAYTYDSNEPGLIALQDIPFPESLVSMAYLDSHRYKSTFERLDAALAALHQEQTQAAADEVSRLLAELGKVHIYFELLWVDWQHRLADSAERSYANVRKMLPRKELAEISKGIASRQEQMRALFASVLDMDAAPRKHKFRISTSETTSAAPDFPFRPLSITFERTERRAFVEILLPTSIFDLMDYHLRECLKREVRMRACRNCGKYFAVTGRSTAEYCNHPFDEKGRTCKEVAAILKWEKSRSGDEVFKEYRREYKKRFARMKAGTVEPNMFYQWSAQAREKKAQCEAGTISFEEFKDWLRQS